MMKVWLPGYSLLGLVAMGCATERPTGTGGDGGSGVVDSAVVAGDVGGKAPAACPESLPQMGAPCYRAGLVCQYGDDPRRTCRPQAACQRGTWIAQQPDCPDPPASTCPASYEQAMGQGCATSGAYCDYAGLSCHCTDCVDHPVPFCDGNPIWRCESPNDDPVCPRAMPNLGTPCKVAALACTYRCGDGGAVRCDAGVWQAGEGYPCPISTRRAKRSIRYLSPEQVNEIGAEALRIRLATYVYRNAGLDPGPQLGFVIEDLQGAGRHFAADSPRGRVNLYGYTSMLLAAVQSQQRALSAMRRELAALRGDRAAGPPSRTQGKARRSGQ